AAISTISSSTPNASASMSAAARDMSTCSKRTGRPTKESHASRPWPVRGRRCSSPTWIASFLPSGRALPALPRSGYSGQHLDGLGDGMSLRDRYFRNIPKALAGGCIAASFLMAWSEPASAYRPFDGTDAAVAAKGEMEIELQPAGRLRDESGASLIAPATVINYGLTTDWEAVLEGIGQTPLSPPGPTNLTAAGAFLKGVLVPGSLQGKSGPSVATEFGVLLPDSTGNSGVGASLAAIVSQRWDWGMIHLNAETALTRDHHGDVFLGAILEGPSKWTVRPVAEI